MTNLEGGGRLELESEGLAAQTLLRHVFRQVGADLLQLQHNTKERGTRATS